MGGSTMKRYTTFFAPTRVLEHGQIGEGNNLLHLMVPFSQLGSDDFGPQRSPSVINPDAQTFSNTNGVKTKPATQTILSRQAGDTFGNTYFK